METGQMKDELARLQRENSDLKLLLLHQKRGATPPLHELSSELLQDQEFALSFVRNKSMLLAWNDLPKQWQDDPKVINAIFESNRRTAPAKKPGRNRVLFKDKIKLNWTDLPYHMKMDKEIIKNALRANLYWKDVPVHFHNDVDLLATAVLYERIDMKDVPEHLQKNHKDVAFSCVQRNYIDPDDCTCLKDDREFWKQVLEEGRANWGQLPSALKTDVDFAFSISCCTEKKLPEQMLEHLVDMYHDQSFWRHMMALQRSSGEERWEHHFQELMALFAPASLFSDFEFMLEMSQTCAALFALVDEGLAGNRVFLEDALAGNVLVLQYLSPEAQLLHSDLVMKAIPHLAKLSADSMHVYYISKSLNASFLSDYDLVMMWVKAGLGIPSQMSDALENDRDVALASVVYTKTFHTVPQTFRTDTSFMLEVVKHHPMLYLEARDDAYHDPRVMATAIAGSMELTERVLVSDLHFKGHDNMIRAFFDFLRRELEPFETFCSCILGNMLSTQSFQDTGNNLALLNQGPETCQMYKKRLAEYLGIPVGEWLCCLQKAERNAREAVAPFWDETNTEEESVA